MTRGPAPLPEGCWPPYATAQTSPPKWQPAPMHCAPDQRTLRRSRRLEDWTEPLLHLSSPRSDRSSVAPPPPRPTTEPAFQRAAGRDRFIDLIRLLGIAVVVLEHWLMPILAYDGNHLTVENALAAPDAWPITWISQVMPLIFFAGGAANAMSWRAHQQRGATAPDWYARRTQRLTWPLLPLAALWIPLPHLLVALGVPEQPVGVGAHVVGQLVWFLGAYLLTTLFTPVMARLPRHVAPLVLVALAAGAATVDTARFLWFGPIGYLNVLLVWLAIHQLGVLYERGALASLTRRRLGGIAAAALIGLVVLVRVAPYPASMIGLPDASTSNMSPPTVCLLLLGLAQISIALLLRPLAQRATRTAAVKELMDWATPRTMTVYLWHMPALVTVALVAVVGLRLSTPDIGATWWMTAPAWLGTLGALLALWLKVFARYEQPPPSTRTVGISTRRLSCAVALVGAGLVDLMCLGFQPQPGAALLFAGPIPAAVALLIGLQLLQRRGPREPSANAFSKTPPVSL
jgi:fucose 4-O-acetylase-like acetyltransferase